MSESPKLRRKATLWREIIMSSYDGISTKRLEHMDVWIDLPENFRPDGESSYELRGAWHLGKVEGLQ